MLTTSFSTLITYGLQIGLFIGLIYLLCCLLRQQADQTIDDQDLGDDATTPTTNTVPYDDGSSELTPEERTARIISLPKSKK